MHIEPTTLPSPPRYAGYGLYGRLGNGATGTNVYTLTRMPGVNDITKYSQGAIAGVALTAGGSVWYVLRRRGRDYEGTGERGYESTG